ncbi:thiamine pyrophosphate-dependent dehydrogenase E1 component subunit alpha, partial [Staphylococcus aureus]|nr:thiamine pyrophosphate-dependent dehydrogenase E1 component subunit alpha [Staphylococcus aureus]
QYAAEKLSDRALGYGIHGEQVDGNDPLAMYKAMKEARERAISGQGSTLIEAVTSRMTAHSSDDDDQYRTKEEREALKKADCNEKFKKELLSAGIIDDAWLTEIEAEHKDIINKATKAAEDAPYPSVEEAYAFVYEEGSLN